MIALNCGEAAENFIKVQLSDVGTFSLCRGARASELLYLDTASRRGPVVAVKVNNSLEDLDIPLEVDCRIDFIDTGSSEGIRVLEAGVVFVLSKAAADVLPGSHVRIEHSLGNAVYGEINYKRPVKDRDIELIERRMKQIVDSDEPLKKRSVDKKEAVTIFGHMGAREKADLLGYWDSSEIVLVQCGEYTDYALGPVVPRLDILKQFRLKFYLPGFILQFPTPDDPLHLPEYREQGRLAAVFYEAEKWGKVLGVHDAPALNAVMERGDPGDLIRVAEAFQEKKISQIADMIASNIGLTRIVLIAGPSSSGKTTFAKRLNVQLKVNGINPIDISMDDYFLERDDTPRDENGEYDFENIEAIDRKLFNEHLIKLIQGEEIERPRYNFKTGNREFSGEKLRLGRRDLVLVEGIHGLNDLLTTSVPKGRKFKIYVSAITHLSLDNTYHIHTSDLRLIRRLVRDYNQRGYSARETLYRWPMVRRGENRYIFPFQEEADVMFNSALIYELAVLRRFVEPLLAGVSGDWPQYSEAKRLLRILGFFETTSCVEVPSNSIIREFIGQSCFY